MGYTMSAAEVEFWQDQAALLDPLAYEWKLTADTVPAGKRWYIANAWYAKVGTLDIFHRQLDYREAWKLPEGMTFGVETSPAGGYYVCKPELVTGSDARYTTDPRALYFGRLQQLDTLAEFECGANNTGSGNVQSTFPGGFTYGLITQVSSMDVAWTILRATDGSGMNTFNEISDSSAIRFATSCIIPFDATFWTKVETKGVSLGTGVGRVSYVKLPGGW